MSVDAALVVAFSVAAAVSAASPVLPNKSTLNYSRLNFW